MRTMNETMRNHMLSLMTDDTVFISPVGSRLYGLHHAESDYDYFLVRDTPMRKSAATVGEFDVRTFNPRLLHEMLFRKPTHTGLDPLFSGMKLYGPAAEKWMPFFSSLRFNEHQVLATFFSAAYGTLNVRDDAKFKRFRLGLLLARFSHELIETGRYNPTLDAADAAALTARAQELFERPEEERPDLLRAEFGRY